MISVRDGCLDVLTLQLEVFDALELSGCGVPRPQPTMPAPIKLNVSSDGTILYVSPDGSDGGTGGIDSPFRTIKHGVTALRASPAPRTLILRGGVHFLNETLQLTPADSGLTISGFPSGTEEAWVSGGVLLPRLVWHKVASALVFMTARSLRSSGSLPALDCATRHRLGHKQQTWGVRGAAATRRTPRASGASNSNTASAGYKSAVPKRRPRTVYCVLEQRNEALAQKFIMRRQSHDRVRTD